ncbi:hypothetical protein R6Q59_036212 [Mikania micrantha]
MEKLLRTPNFDGFPCLQKLELDICPKLKEIHPSLENHTSLQYVRVSYCNKLRMFPTITNMKNLKKLYITRCPQIHEFPKIHANMESLVELSIIFNGVEVLPSSIGEHCTNLISLKLYVLNNFKSINVNFDAFKHLKKLHLNGLIQHVETRRPSFHQSLRQKLGLYASLFNKVEIPSSIIELSNLQELDLSYNDFSRLDFSLSHLTQLKFLDVSFCRELLELPELPSSLLILSANFCESLTTFGDCHKNCRWLCQVLLHGGSIIKDGDRLLESMLEACMAIENYYMLLRLDGIQITKGLTPLVRGNRYTLQLPENWRNEFSGFLMCRVMPRFYITIDVRISKNEEMNGMDSQHDVSINWEDTDTDNTENYGSGVAYVSFNMLRQTAWWDQTCKALTFEAREKYRNDCRGFGVRLIEKKRKSGLTETSTIYPSGYAPYLKIEQDSPSTINISDFYYQIHKKLKNYM